MKTAFTRQKYKTTAGYEHVTDIVRDPPDDPKGEVVSYRLVSRTIKISLPELSPLPMPPASTGINCVKGYKKALENWLSKYKQELDFFELVCLYHEARMEYVYRHRNDDIPEKYRTGEDVPTSIMQLIKETAKLKIRR